MFETNSKLNGWQVVVAAGEYTTGSAWLSEEKLLEQARDMWKRLSDEQKGAYGEDYFENALRSLEKYTKGAVSSKNVTTLNFSVFIALLVCSTPQYNVLKLEVDV